MRSTAAAESDMAGMAVHPNGSAEFHGEGDLSKHEHGFHPPRQAALDGLNRSPRSRHHGVTPPMRGSFGLSLEKLTSPIGVHP